MLFAAQCILATAAQSAGGEWTETTAFSGPIAGAFMGQDLDWIGDVDGDGCDDFIVGAPGQDVGSPTGIELGAVYVVSGKSGQGIYSLTAASTPGFRLGWRVSRMDDVDLNGTPDVALLVQAGTSNLSNYVSVRSGSSFQELYRIDTPQPVQNTVTFGVSGVRGGEDLSGDGIGDLVVADKDYYTGPGSPGAVFAFDGANGALLWVTYGPVDDIDFGSGISCPGDLNGDGSGDVLVGSYFSVGLGAGAVHALSGADGSELFRLDGPYSEGFAGLGGHRLDGVEDADGDGLADFFVGAIQPSSPGVNGYGTIHRGFDGAIMHRWEGPVYGDSYGWSVAALGDVDADGVSDFAVGAPEEEFPGFGPGRAFIYSGRTKAGLTMLQSNQNAFKFASVISPGSGDINADGLMDVLIGDPAEDAGGLGAAGAVHVFSFHPFLRVNTLTISNSAGGTLDFALDFPASEAGRGYRFLASHDLPGSTTVQGVQIPLVVTPLLLRVLHNPPALLQNPVGTLDANGDGAVSAAFPAQALPGYVGLTLKFAAISEFSPGQPSLSSAPAWVEVTP